MSFAEERKAIETRLAGSGITEPIKYPNAKLNNPGEARWVALNFVPGEGTDIEIGPAPRLRRYFSVAVIQIFEVLHQGTRVALALADTLAALYRDQVLTAGTGRIRCYVPRIEEIGPDGLGWYQINVVIPYKRDIAQ